VFRATKTKEKKPAKPYTRNPKDYAQQFVEGVKQINSRPKQMHSYANSALEGRGEKEGTFLLTQKDDR
jgi:hypothetical protein